MILNQYIFVSIKTTGTDVRYDRLTEIALFAYERETLTMRLHSFLCSGSSGQSSSFLNSQLSSKDKGTPHFFEIAKNLLEHTQNMVFVSHNVRFVYSFICKAYENLGFTYTRKKICTKNLAKELYPELPSYALNDLCHHLNIEVPETGDTIGHARCTALLFKHLMEQQEATAHRLSRKTKFPAGMSLEWIETLPNKPGVYYMKDHSDRVIYVGKSVHIRKRIAEHFTANTRKSAKLQESVSNIEYELTSNEIEAEILEVYRIREYMPRINRAMRSRKEPYGLYVQKNDQGYLGFRIKKLGKINDRPDVYTFSSRSSAESLLWALIEEFVLCAKISNLEKATESCFNHSVKKCYGACIGEELVDEYNTRVQLGLNHIVRLPENAEIKVPSDYPDDNDLIIQIRNRRFHSMGRSGNRRDDRVLEGYEPNYFADQVLLKYLVKNRRDLIEFYEEE